MCGIAGFVLSPSARLDAMGVLRRMTDSLVHRGPDGADYQLIDKGKVGMGHRRLSVVDLTSAGTQPMVSGSGRYIITFNGEVYNFRGLRAELESSGSRFRGHSDTEVMLAAMDTWGIPAAVHRFNGMFAFAVWDAQERELWLGRDRLGKKPLYTGLANGSLVFASELKALKFFPGFADELDRGALTLFLRHNYIPAPWSVYKSVSKLLPGTLRRVRIRNGKPELMEDQTYWSATAKFADGRVKRFSGSAEEAVSALESLLRTSVADRMIADVPLGAFLSGGIDSSTVVALMQAQSSRRVRTFSIGFEEEAFNEAPHAARIARALNTDHTEAYLSASDALEVVPLLPAMFDEPFSDSSQIPTYLVSRIARRQVTVSLSGDGGDELFCGYPRYQRWRSVWKTMKRVPAPLRRIMARAIRGVSVRGWDAVLRPFAGMRAAGTRSYSPGDKLHKLSEILGSTSPEFVYRRFLSHCMHPEQVVIDAVEPDTVLSRPGGPADTDGFTEQMMLLDVMTYLPDDILVKVDRASMAVSLEVRGPLLDHRVVELAASFPLGYKLRDGVDKWVLRQVLLRHLPAHFFDRPKMGFGVPIDSWLRGPLRDWAEDLLSERVLRSEGVFRAEPIRRMWTEFLERSLPWHYPLWDVLMFQAWYKHARIARC